MDLLQWAPVVTMVESRPGQKVPKLEIRAWLRCLFCGQVTDVRTNPTLLAHFTSPDGRKLTKRGDTGTHLDSAESRTHAAITQIKQQRCCDECGTASIMPPAQADQFRLEILRVINDDWIAGQIDAIRPSEPIMREDLNVLVRSAVLKAILDLDLPSLVEVKLAKALQERA